MNRATWTLLRVAAIACSGLVTLARAGFNNGGFETGDFSGWTVRQGFNNYDNDLTYYGIYGQPHGLADPVADVAWGFENTASTAPTPTVVDKSGYTDPYYADVQDMFNGSRMAKLNDIEGNWHVTQISQTGTIDLGDLTGGATSADLYINWAGIMDNPGHYGGNDPWFIINVSRNGGLFFTEKHYSTDPGWKYAGSYYYDPVYMNFGQVHLSGLNVGDQVNVELTVADCAFGGHGAYAYLDGIGTAYVPPPGPGVPDASSTLWLVGPALLGLLALRRKQA